MDYCIKCGRKVEDSDSELCSVCLRAELEADVDDIVEDVRHLAGAPGCYWIGIHND